MNNNIKPNEITTEFYDYEVKTVGKGSSSGVIYVPKKWIGKKAKILLIEPLDR